MVKKVWSLYHLPATSFVSSLRPLKGFKNSHCTLQGPSSSHSILLQELKIYKDNVSRETLGAEIPGRPLETTEANLDCVSVENTLFVQSSLP